MRGYYGDKETKELLKDGYFATGDIGKIDEDGYLYITGRKKDLIIRGGVNISPRQIEDILLRHDYVEEAVVIGIPHSIYGEEIVAVIKIKDACKSRYSDKDLKQYCRDNISLFKCPKKFIVIDTFPKSVTGKIQKNKLKSMLMNVEV